MPFIEIGFNAKRPLILGRGGFGTQLNDWLMDEGWGSADFLDDNAPDAVGGLALLCRGRVALLEVPGQTVQVHQPAAPSIHIPDFPGLAKPPDIGR